MGFSTKAIAALLLGIDMPTNTCQEIPVMADPDKIYFLPNIYTESHFKNWRKLHFHDPNKQLS